MEKGVATTENNTVAKREATVFNKVLSRITEMQQYGELKIAPNYSVENAIKAAYFVLTDMVVSGKAVLELCTTDSISSSILKMCVEGLSISKHQGSFIAYGNKLSWQREYMGSIALAKRVGMKTVTANCIFEGDIFKFKIDPETGLKSIIEHSQDYENIDITKIKGAYAITTMEDGTRSLEVMNMTQIRAAWNQGAMKGNSPAHKNFTDQMCMKTVINRACKPIINSSDDSYLYDDEIDDSMLLKGAKTEDIPHTEISFEKKAKPEPESIKIEAVKVEQVENVEAPTGEMKFD